MSGVPDELVKNLFVKSSNASDFGSTEVKGYDFNDGIDYEKLFNSYATTGFQACNFAKAVDEINKMLDKKQEPVENEGELNLDPHGRPRTSCTIFLGFTSNIVSSGMRDIVRFLAEHNMVDCIVTTAGGIEEDLIKCLAPSRIGSFDLQGARLREAGINRIGNLIIPNDNYCLFEDWIMPILDQLLKEQQTEHVSWTPSKFIRRLGKEINHPSSILYWCYKNNIPVHSPALTDGSLGDMLYVHSFKGASLKLDIVEDVVTLNKQSVHSSSTGMLILGGGLIKHHICNANLMRNGADYSVFVNTASEFDGSDSGAAPDEAVSWGKIKKTAQPVKVFGEASLIFPLLVAQTFAKRVSK